MSNGHLYRYVIAICFCCCIIVSGCESNEDVGIQWAINNSGELIGQKRGVKGIDIGMGARAPLMMEGECVVVIDGFFDINNSFMNEVVVNMESVREYMSTYPVDIRLTEHPYYVTGIITGRNGDEYRSITQGADIFYIPINVEDVDMDYILGQLSIAENLGAKVVNCSFVMNEYNEAFHSYICKSDMLFVCAVGNEGEQAIRMPASYECDNIISVAGCDNCGYCSTYSNYSEEADIAAPGEDILCRTSKEGIYEYASGSSLATAHVTAICAYLAKNNDQNSMMIKQRLFDASRKLQSLEGKVSEGRLLQVP